MDINFKRDILIFSAVLIVLGAGFAIGITYFNTQPSPQTINMVATSTTAASGSPSMIIVVAASATSSKALPLVLPYSPGKSTMNEIYWPKAWGTVSFTNNKLILTPDPVTHGSNSFLNGASSWSNYAISADVSWLMGGSFDIVARTANNTRDFVYCEFGSNGTFIIQRVNGADTEIAHAAATSTGMQGALGKFGMKVYGNEIGCSIADREVVGTSTVSNESPTGGIGFVIFNAPQQQKQVEINNIYVTALSYNTIAAPFPVAVVTPSPAPTPTPGTAPQPTPPTPSTPTPAPTAPTAKTLPYFANTFGAGDGWGESWGTFLEAPDGLTIGANSTLPSGGALLAGTAAWNNYTFQATLDWVKGETFGMFARHTDDKNYVVCEFDERFPGDVQIRLEQFVRGNENVLNQTDVTGYNQVGISNLVAYVKVQDTVGTCSFDHHVITNAMSGNTINPPYSGKIGFTTWDPNPNNSQIIVRNISVASNY